MFNQKRLGETDTQTKTNTFALSDKHQQETQMDKIQVETVVIESVSLRLNHTREDREDR